MGENSWALIKSPATKCSVVYRGGPTVKMVVGHHLNTGSVSGNLNHFFRSPNPVYLKIS